MKPTRVLRRSVVLLILLAVAVVGTLLESDSYPETLPQDSRGESVQGEALSALYLLEIKGRAPKTGYARAQFGEGWRRSAGCDMRNVVLLRDLKNTVVNDKCQVVTGILDDPYTGRTIVFQRGEDSSQAVQIDHVVALSDAWQKGAQQLTFDERVRFANDPLGLLAVGGEVNQEKGDSDAATWLPPARSFRCQYIARQIAVKQRYHLWVTESEKVAMARVLEGCPNQKLPAGL